MPWPHSGSDASSAEKSRADQRPADARPDASAESRPPASAAHGSSGTVEPARLKSTDVTRPFVRGPETTSTEGADTPNGSTSAGSDSDDQASKKGAHRLNTEAYPVVNEPVSMRPRNEPVPEPAELFRPAARDAKTSGPARPATPDTVNAPSGGPTNGADGRSLAPVPPGAGKSDGRTD